MKIRLLGLAVLAALAVAAFVGAGSASAITLCKANENPCSAGNRYPSGTTILGKSSTSFLENESLAVECEEATVEIKTTAESGSPLPAKLTLPTFAGCSEGETECTQEALLDPYEAFFYEPGGGNGRLGLYEEPNDEFEMKVQCGGLTCVYDGGMKFKIAGGNPAKMTVFAWAPTLESGVGCASTATWTVEYSLNNLSSPLYIEALP